MYCTVSIYGVGPRRCRGIVVIPRFLGRGRETGTCAPMIRHGAVRIDGGHPQAGVPPGGLGNLILSSVVARHGGSLGGRQVSLLSVSA